MHVCAGHVTAATYVKPEGALLLSLFDHISAEADRQSWTPLAKSFPFQAYTRQQFFVVYFLHVGTNVLSDAVECTRRAMRRACWTLT